MYHRYSDNRRLGRDKFVSIVCSWWSSYFCVTEIYEKSVCERAITGDGIALYKRIFRKVGIHTPIIITTIRNMMAP